MTAERWRQVKEILDALEECPAAEREAEIARACSGDWELRGEVESLLAFEGRAAAMERPEFPLGVPVAGVPERVGPYRIERLLGSGGMGSVFLAARDDDQYRKRVAIKLIQWAGDPESANRFRIERQVLAGLEHPNIARLLDGGALPDGQPYLVMEYIDGLSADGFVRQRGLETDAVLQLFLKICAAVQFAHRNMVIHRDIKAGNILVSEDGEPHLLDFGIARLMNPAGPEMSRTQPWQRVLTPVSASPEQAEGGPVTTASDVYSLGVLLYQLLTGVAFYAGVRDFASDPGRAIREHEPPAASQTPGLPARVRRWLAGDLDNIVRKATAKDPARRYSTVDELAADIRRHREGQPVAARPASFVYRMGKFVRRNRVFVGAAALLLLAIAGGTTGTAWYAWRAHLAEGNAERRFEALHRLTNSLLFEVDDVLASLQGATSARAAIVRRTLEYLDQMAADSGNNQAVLRDLATAYVRIGRIQGAEYTAHLGGPGSLEAARASYRKALAIRERLAAAEPANVDREVELEDAQAAVSDTYMYEGDLDRALELNAKIAARASGLAARMPAHDRQYDELQYRVSATLTGMGDLCSSLGDLPRALDYSKRALAIREALLAAHPGDKRAMRVVGIGHNYLGYAWEEGHRPEEAAAEERLALAQWEPLQAADPLNADLRSLVADGNEHLCLDLTKLGRFAEATLHCENALGLYRKSLDADPHDVQAEEDLATAFSAMSDLRDAMGRTREALGWEEKAREAYRVVEAKDPDALQSAIDDASSLLHRGLLERKLGMTQAGAEGMEGARGMLERLMKKSPKNRLIAEVYERAAAAR